MKMWGRASVGMFWMTGLALLAGCGQQRDQAEVDSNAGAAAIVEADPDPAVNATSAAPAVVPRAEEIRAVETAGLLPPRAEIVPATRVEGAIAFAFRTAQPPAEVARWYRAARGFDLQSEMDEGGEHVLSGSTARPAGDFSVRLAAQRGGGTTAMVVVTPRR